jgi:predicted transcriptional regulator
MTNVEDMKVNEVMSTSVLSSPHNSSILNICAALNHANVGSIVIADDQRKPIGIITKSDVIRIIASGPASLHVPVNDVMSKPLITINSDLLIRDAILLMNLRNIKRLIVLDEKQELAGILTQSDIVHMLKTDLFLRDRFKSY